LSQKAGLLYNPKFLTKKSSILTQNPEIIATFSVFFSVYPWFIVHSIIVFHDY